MTPHFLILWSFGPKIGSVDGICHQTDSMNRFYLDVKTGPEHPPLRVENVKTFRWDQKLQKTGVPVHIYQRVKGEYKPGSPTYEAKSSIEKNINGSKPSND